MHVVDSGALKMALNVLRRAGKTEVADALEAASATLDDPIQYGAYIDSYLITGAKEYFERGTKMTMAGVFPLYRLPELPRGDLDARERCTGVDTRAPRHVPAPSVSLDAMAKRAGVPTQEREPSYGERYVLVSGDSFGNTPIYLVPMQGVNPPHWSSRWDRKSMVSASFDSMQDAQAYVMAMPDALDAATPVSRRITPMTIDAALEKWGIKSYLRPNANGYDRRRRPHVLFRERARVREFWHAQDEAWVGEWKREHPNDDNFHFESAQQVRDITKQQMMLDPEYHYYVVTADELIDDSLYGIPMCMERVDT